MRYAFKYRDPNSKKWYQARSFRSEEDRDGMMEEYRSKDYECKPVSFPDTARWYRNL